MAADPSVVTAAAPSAAPWANDPVVSAAPTNAAAPTSTATPWANDPIVGAPGAAGEAVASAADYLAPGADWFAQQGRNMVEGPINAAVDAYHIVRSAIGGVPELANKPVPFNTALTGPAQQFQNTYVTPAVQAITGALNTPLRPTDQPGDITPAFLAAEHQKMNALAATRGGRLVGDVATVAPVAFGAAGLVRGAADAALSGVTSAARDVATSVAPSAADFTTSAGQAAAESAARESAAAARAIPTAAPTAAPTMRATPEQMIAEGRGLIKSRAAADAAEPTTPGGTAPETASTSAAPQPVSGFGAAPESRKPRAQILSDVISPNADIRNSALDSDIPATQVETNAANASSTEGGAHLANVFTQERDGMRSYFQNLIDQAGGSAGTDEVAREQRGTLLSGAAEQARDAMAAQTSDLYGAADARAANIGPMAGKLTNFKQLLTSQQGDWALQDKSSVWNAINDRVNELGLGELGDGDVKATNALRKSLSDAYNFQTYHLTKPLIDTLDDDVTSAAGSDIYQAGRSLRKVRADYLDNNPAVRKIMAAPRDPDGIQRPVPLDNIGQHLTNASSAQLGNYVQMLKYTAGQYPQLAGGMASALNALKSEYLNNVVAKGFGTEAAPYKFWNHKAVDRYLNEHASGMAHVFTPADIRKIRLGHQAGDILRTDKQYAGAAGQTLGVSKLVQGAMKFGQSGAVEAIGTHVGGGIPGLIGGHLAAKGLEKLGEKLTKRAVMRRFSNLRDVLAE